MKYNIKRLGLFAGAFLFALFATAPTVLAASSFKLYDVPTANSDPMDIVAGPDGNMWFVEFNLPANKVAKITMDGDITEYNLPSAGNPFSIAVAPDGHLWVSSGSNLYRVTTGGVIDEFPISPAGGSAGALVVDNDGNVWFTRTDNQIGVRMADGSFAAFPVTSPGAFGHITLGPDGNIWFVEQDANNIGMITPDGTVTEYPIPTTGSIPIDIITGPDGNLWFTESDGNKVGRITTTGIITEYSPDAPWFGFLKRMTNGPDGNIWMTADSNQIVRFELNGTFTMYDIPGELPPNGFSPGGIATGPDGNIWFTRVNSNQIGVFLLSGVEPAPPISGTAPTIGTPGAPSTGFGAPPQNTLESLIPYGLASVLIMGIAFGLYRCARRRTD